MLWQHFLLYSPRKIMLKQTRLVICLAKLTVQLNLQFVRNLTETERYIDMRDVVLNMGWNRFTARNPNTPVVNTNPPGDLGRDLRKEGSSKGLWGWKYQNLATSLGVPHAYRPKDEPGVASGNRFTRPVCNISSTI